jgi:hypothetical protein
VGGQFIEKDLLMEINEIRRQAASDALRELDGAFQRVQARYDNKHKLRTLLHQSNSTLSLKKLANHLAEIRQNATTFHQGTLDKSINEPIGWAEEQLELLKTILVEARDLAVDLRAFEIDKSSLDQGTTFLFEDGKLHLRAGKDGLAALGKIWEEAFTLAGGICLRHERLDGGLCRIAEALIQEANWIRGKAFAIPSRTGVSILPNVVHLRFPEWTIWALPLTAQEVWQLRLRSSGPGLHSGSEKLLDAVVEHTRTQKDGQNKAKELEASAQNVWGNADFQRCMGDVFGVFALGPAYACACIDLTLDPNEESSKQRALSIFRTLASVGDYNLIQTTLRNQWQEVVGDLGNLAHELWIDAVWAFLTTTPSGFIVDRWREQRSELVDALRSVKISSLSPATVKLRYLINAAWKARLEFPAETDQIATRCKEFADALVTAMEESITGGLSY